MTNESKRPRRRKQQTRVSLAVTVAIMILALIAGALAGFAVARRTDPNRKALVQANDRVMELENTLTLIGFDIDSDDPQQWVFDDSAQTDAAAALSGRAPNRDTGDLWIDDGLLASTLDDTAAPVVVAEFDGGQLLSTEVIPEFNDQLTTQIFAGYSAGDVSQTVLDEVLRYMVSEKLIEQQAKALNLDALTDEDEADIAAQAAAEFARQKAYYAMFAADGQPVEDYMRDEAGVTLDSIADSLRAHWATQKYYDYVVKDVAVTDAEIQAHYQERLAAQREDFSQYTEEFEYAHMEGDVILYNPEGYRAVRSLLIAFDDPADAALADSLLEQLDRAQDDAARADIEAQLDVLYAPLQAIADEVAQKLQSGATFASMLEAYGQDEQMRQEPLKSEGYYLSENTFLFSAEFVQGSMILDTPGQVSSPLRSASGLHLVEYLGNVPAGDVPLDQVRDKIAAEALEIKRSAHYAEATQALLDEAHVKYYPERLQ